jgi:hypothetical protein
MRIYLLLFLVFAFSGCNKRLPDQSIRTEFADFYSSRWDELESRYCKVEFTAVTHSPNLPNFPDVGRTKQYYDLGVTQAINLESQVPTETIEEHHQSYEKSIKHLHQFNFVAIRNAEYFSLLRVKETNGTSSYSIEDLRDHLASGLKPSKPGGMCPVYASGVGLTFKELLDNKKVEFLYFGPPKDEHSAKCVLEIRVPYTMEDGQVEYGESYFYFDETGRCVEQENVGGTRRYILTCEYDDVGNPYMLKKFFENRDKDNPVERFMTHRTLVFDFKPLENFDHASAHLPFYGIPEPELYEKPVRYMTYIYLASAVLLFGALAFWLRKKK